MAVKSSRKREEKRGGVGEMPLEHPSHQSIKKHLPYTQHDLFFVNTIVSLYPSIIIPLIPLAVRFNAPFKVGKKKPSPRESHRKLAKSRSVHFILEALVFKDW